MATGLSLPIRAINGRAARATGEDHLRKLIMTACADCDSANPYQEDLGIDTQIVFALHAEQVKAFARRRITDAFDRLKAAGLAELRGPPSFSKLNEGEMVCSIQYINLETTEKQELELVGRSPFELFRSITRRTN